MTTNAHTRTDTTPVCGEMTARRALGLLLFAVTAGVLLHTAQGSLSAPPIAGPARLGSWWTSEGAATATLSIMRVAGVALCGYLGLLGLLGTITAITRWRWAQTLTRLIATPALRRALIGGTIAVAVSSSSTAVAATPTVYAVSEAATVEDVTGSGISEQRNVYVLSDIGSAAPQEFKLTDLGAEHPESRTGQEAATESSFSLADLGPAGNFAASHTSSHDTGLQNHQLTTDRSALLHEAADPSRDDSHDDGNTGHAHSHSSSQLSHQTHGDRVAGVEQSQGGDVQLSAVWQVEQGDHLWGIAASTVADRSGTPVGDHMTVLRYWLKLIEVNDEVLGDDPDLIHPGQLIRLPM